MSWRQRRIGRVPFNILAAVAMIISFGIVNAQKLASPAVAAGGPFCGTHPQFCTETHEPWNYKGQYTGHDEPSVLYYSTTAGSGNSNLYRLTLPADPPTLPVQNGTGGTWNFMLHPAFWFGMAMCDDQSAPSPGKSCTPDTDSNVYTSTNPNSPSYIGKSPGEGFMEMQFYPPGWAPWPAGVSCNPTQWCAALNIDSLTQDMNTGVYNNAACLNVTGAEYVNFAFITKSGVPQPNSPPNPVESTNTTFTPDPSADLFMNSGDKLTVAMNDTPAGFQVVIHDLTTGQTGSMTASAANGFGHPLYQPNAATCTEQAYSFHPMFATSQSSTRVLWAAHSYNVAFSDEIGHFEYCDQSNGQYNCAQAGGSDPAGLDGDDTYCLTSLIGTTNRKLSGCLQSDDDFDGAPYQRAWPGSLSDPSADASVHPTPISFSSPLFTAQRGGAVTNYSQVAFETDLPRIESSDSSSNNNCQRHVSNPSDPSPGSGCVDPPNGANFYPIYSAVNVGGTCAWQEGGANLPGTINSFGGTSTAEYGALLPLSYPEPNGVSVRYNDFRNILGNNPCPAPAP